MVSHSARRLITEAHSSFYERKVPKARVALLRSWQVSSRLFRITLVQVLPVKHVLLQQSYVKRRARIDRGEHAKFYSLLTVFNRLIVET